MKIGLLLEQISVVYCLFHSLIIFLFIYEHRYAKRTFVIAFSLMLTAYVSVSTFIMLRYDINTTGKLLLLTCTIPSFIFYYVFSTFRGARFVFLFCFTDTISAWVIVTSNLIDFALGDSGFVLFFLRLLAFPLMEYALWRWGRRPVLMLEWQVDQGWWLFALVAATFYLLLNVMANFPVNIVHRPEDIPAMILILSLMPTIYLSIVWSLYQQLRTYQARERNHILEIQTEAMRSRVREQERLEQQFAIQRHDMRHTLSAVAALLEQEKSGPALELLYGERGKLDQLHLERWCTDPVLDATLAPIFARARQLGVRVDAKLTFPKELPVDAAELSAVFANALENALRACADLPEDKREIICTSVAFPTLMFQVANPYAGEVRFDKSGLPIALRKGHGIGSQSIAAFCQKHGALCTYEAKDGWFKLKIAL